MSHLRLEYANCLSERVNAHGLDAGAIDEGDPRMATLTIQLNESAGTGSERWRRLSVDPLRSEHLDSVRGMAGKLRPNTDNLLVLGIGGSALGLAALHHALNPSTYNLMPRSDRGGPRLFILDNVDPTLVDRTIAEIRRVDPRFERTLINVISKSGETPETAAQFMLLRRMLVDALGDDHADRIVAITDPASGTLRSICVDSGYAMLPVPEGVGGRFSVLSPVGLFGAAMCGIDIGALLDGAAAMDERCRETDLRTNPAAMLAWLLVELGRAGKTNHVMMPYANALAGLADWYCQLWAESLGKRLDGNGREVFAGFTPIRALGATDQHSQIQLYREGPHDKVIGIVAVDEYANDLDIPAGLGVGPTDYLEGHTLGQLLDAERRATEFALTESDRPNFTITIPRLDAFSIGQFIQLWQVTTAYAGAMLEINAYDQPAVETGKQATFGLMGRAGFDEWKMKVQQSLSEHSHCIPPRN